MNDKDEMNMRIQEAEEAFKKERAVRILGLIITFVGVMLFYN